VQLNNKLVALHGIPTNLICFERLLINDKRKKAFKRQQKITKLIQVLGSFELKDLIAVTVTVTDHLLKCKVKKHDINLM